VWKSQADSPHLPKDCSQCAIREMTVCGAMRSDQLDALQRFKSCDRILPVHTHLYRTGEHPGEIYNLLSGWVALYRILESGRRQILQIARPGAFLAYQADLDDQMHHSAVCISDVAVCIFPRRTFPALLERHPALQSKLAGILAQEVAAGQDQLTNLGARSGIERVAYFLLQAYLQQRPQRLGTNTVTMTIPMTQEIIGDALGITQVHINRILKQLRERQLAALHRGILEILDLEGLRRVANVSEMEAFGVQR
jgi:CRP-like cAMP-binding protein